MQQKIPTHIHHIYQMQKHFRKKKTTPVETVPSTKEYTQTFCQGGYNLFFANKSNIKQFVIFLFDGNVDNAMKCYRIIKEFYKLSNDDTKHIQNYITAKNTMKPDVWTPWMRRMFARNGYKAIQSIIPSTLCDECLRTCKNLFQHRFCHNCLLPYPPYVSCLQYWAVPCLVSVHEQTLATYEYGLVENVMANDYLVANVMRFL